MQSTAPGERVAAYRHARERVLERIAAAAARVGRDPAGVTLLAVSKTVSADALRDAVAAGLDRLGENRVQEAIAKAADVPGARWQLVGPLQANKARKAMDLFESIWRSDSIASRAKPGRRRGTPSCCRSTSTTTRPRPASTRLSSRRSSAASAASPTWNSAGS